jgi:N-acetyl sugar amidotransferase
VCSACRHYENRPAIDWNERKLQLIEILNRIETKTYDCLIPVSGGKDSHFQVIKMLELGAHPLCVTASTDDLSDIGRANIENLKGLGVDYIEVSTNPRVRRKINRIALERVGDISWPEHVAIFTIPVRVACQMGIPLIVWGENPQNEYGGPQGTGEARTLDRRWLEEYGGLLGLRVSDLIDEGIPERDLALYRYPSEEECKGTRGIFLGQYLAWDGRANAEEAKRHGFTTYGKMVEGSTVDYENLDNCQTGIHDFFKYLKFGFGRTTDLVSMAIRRGLLKREEALSLVRERDGVFPWSYLGRSLLDTLNSIGMTYDDFISCCESFTNWSLFKNKSVLKLEKVNYDNAS